MRNALIEDWLNIETSLFQDKEYMEGIEVVCLEWEKRSCASVILRGHVPLAAKKLLAIKDGDKLELMHGDCGNLSDYYGQTLAIGFNDCKIIKTWSKNLSLPREADCEKPITFYVRLECVLETWQ